MNTKKDSNIKLFILLDSKMVHIIQKYKRLVPHTIAVLNYLQQHAIFLIKARLLSDIETRSTFVFAARRYMSGTSDCLWCLGYATCPQRSNLSISLSTERRTEEFVPDISSITSRLPIISVCIVQRERKSMIKGRCRKSNLVSV